MGISVAEKAQKPSQPTTNLVNQRQLTPQKTNQTTWLDEELKQTNSPIDYEQRPSLKLQPNKIVEIEVDFLPKALQDKYFAE